LSKSYMNLDVTYNYAADRLAAKNPVEIAGNAGAEYDPEKGIFRLKYLGDDYIVSYPGGEVNFAAQRDEEPSLTVKILILHYLITANGVPMQNKHISFKELPDGAIYIEPFTRRAVKPMLKIFGGNPEELVRVAKEMGGLPQDLGDISVTIFPFPRVPITYVIWAGDDEFPASGNILFDASAPYYLPTEDYALLSGLLVYQMGDISQKKQ